MTTGAFLNTAGWGETRARLGTIHTVSLDVLVADLTDSDGSQTFDFPATWAGTFIVVGADVRVTTPLAGGTISAGDVDLGDAGDTDAIIDGADVFSAAVDGQAASYTAGIAPFKRFSGATTFQMTVNATGDTLDNATAFSATGTIYFAQII